MPEANPRRAPQATVPRQLAAARKLLSKAPVPGDGRAGVTRERAA